MKELTQTLQVTRNNKPESAYYRALQRQQAKRTIKRVLWHSMKLTGQSTIYVMGLFADAGNGDRKNEIELREWFGWKPVLTAEQKANQERNHLGQYA